MPRRVAFFDYADPALAPLAFSVVLSVIGVFILVLSGLLFFLDKKDGALMREAGAALDLGPSAMSGLVDRTADAGLIERRPDANDGRAWQLWLTPAGRTAMAQAKEGLTELNARLTDGFTDAEIDVVARWLASLQTKFPTGDEQ